MKPTVQLARFSYQFESISWLYFTSCLFSNQTINAMILHTFKTAWRANASRPQPSRCEATTINPIQFKRAQWSISTKPNDLNFIAGLSHKLKIQLKLSSLQQKTKIKRPIDKCNHRRSLWLFHSLVFNQSSLRALNIALSPIAPCSIQSRTLEVPLCSSNSTQIGTLHPPLVTILDIFQQNRGRIVGILTK